MGMNDLLPSAPWIWLALGLVLLGLETMAPGLFIFWIGLAAIATGLVVWPLPLGFTGQLILFALFALACILIGRQVQQRQKGGAADAPFLNERGRSLIGQTFPLETAIVNGAGSVRIGDTVWRVSGSDLKMGRHVRITGVDGATLTVEPVNP